MDEQIRNNGRILNCLVRMTRSLPSRKEDQYVIYLSLTGCNLMVMEDQQQNSTATEGYKVLGRLKKAE